MQQELGTRLSLRLQRTLRNNLCKYSLLALFSLFNLNNLAYSQGSDAHHNLFQDTKFPRAKDCGTCHPQQYKEWSASPHAYAQLSPVFNAMHRTLLKKTNGTVGDFCIRCHTPTGMQQGEALAMDNMKRSPASLEGVTCITCHRRDEPVGKVSGRMTLIEGDIFEPVYGPFAGDELKRIIQSLDYDVNAVRGKKGRAIHAEAFKFEEISKPGFCGACHDVNSAAGMRLEEAFSEYKSSPAASVQNTCQDCHMGKVPGVPSGYEHKPIALVGGKPSRVRKHSNHMFVGPDYSIVHPGIFPHNEEAEEFASIEDWVDFNFEAGWGTDEFEFQVAADYQFPERWEDAGDRYEAREIIEQNLEQLEYVAAERKKLLQHGYGLGEIVVKESSADGVAFQIEFKNTTKGHNVPTGFDGERLVFLRTTLTDSAGREVFVSGDLDPNGDLRDSHSVYVHDGKLELDEQLFSLQSRFLINMIRGGDREEILPVNYSASPLPFVRPPTSSTLLVGRPRGARKHRQTIPPLSSRWANYKVSADKLKGTNGPYTLNVKLIAGMVPVNLVHAIKDVGFDYKMSPREVADAIVSGHQVLWEKELEIIK